MDSAKERSRFPLWLTAVLVALCVCIIAGGYWFYRDQDSSARGAARDELHSIAQLKVGQIVRWRAERLGNAGVISDSPLSAGGVQRWLDSGHPADEADLRAWLNSVMERYAYSGAVLADSFGEVLLAVGSDGQLAPEGVAAVKEAIAKRVPLLTDPHENSDGTVHIDAVAPLYLEADTSSEPLGAVVLHTDASEFLFPLIQSWPTPSDTAETLLVRRAGDQVLFLNELRFRSEAALRLTFPLSETGLPAAMAVQGVTGLVEGPDYRGVEVLADLRPVPGSSWFMVAKVDKSEALAGVGLKSGLIFGLVFVAVAAITGGSLLTWQWGLKRRYREAYAAEAALRASEEQLRQAQKMEAVGQLAGGIAHDFNNLLTAILGYSDLLLADEQVAALPQKADVEEIHKAAERAGSLTRQLLAFSRRQALRPEVISPNSILTGMEPLLRRTLGEDIDLVSLTQADVGHVEIDLHQFEQVLLNLALNARDAMPNGGKLTLEVANVELGEKYCSSHPEATPGSYVMLAVSDTGTGMDEATRTRVFEPFFTTKPPGQGTGLGLAMVYGMVKQSRGNVFVYSELGHGTTFKIYLPRVAERCAPERTALPHVPARGGRETVLVVEDESSLRILIERVLEGAGYQVVTFGSADAAADALDSARVIPDLLLTDIVLPGSLQGKDLADRALAQMPELRVLYISGYTRNAIVHAGRLDEGVNFLEKPFTPEALARAVRQVLDGAEGPG